MSGPSTIVSRFSRPLCFASSLLIHSAGIIGAGQIMSPPSTRGAAREKVVDFQPGEIVLIDPVGPVGDPPGFPPRRTPGTVRMTGNVFKTRPGNNTVVAMLTRRVVTSHTPPSPPPNRLFDDGRIRQGEQGTEPSSRSPAQPSAVAQGAAKSLPRPDSPAGESKWVDGVGTCLGETGHHTCSKLALSGKEIAAVIDKKERDRLSSGEWAVKGRMFWKLPKAEAVKPKLPRIPPLCLGPICLVIDPLPIEPPAPLNPSHVIDDDERRRVFP